MKSLLCFTGFLLFAITTYAQDCNNENAQSHYAKAAVVIKEAKTEADYLFAIDELKKALIYAPDCPDIYFNLGMAYEKSADTGKADKDINSLKQAIDNFKKYLDKSPDAQDKETVKAKIYELEFKYDKLSAPIIRKAKKSVYFGFYGGLNLQSYSLSYNHNSSKQITDTGVPSIGGFQIGMFIEIRLSDIVSIQPGVDISGRNSGLTHQDQYLIDVSSM